jgi:hypothetical protein
MKAVYLTIIALLLAACLAEADFKETEKTKEASHGAPPDIKIPENLRLRVGITQSFNFGVGLDIVKA